LNIFECFVVRILVNSGGLVEMIKPYKLKFMLTHLHLFHKVAVALCTFCAHMLFPYFHSTLASQCNLNAVRKLDDHCMRHQTGSNIQTQYPSRQSPRTHPGSTLSPLENRNFKRYLKFIPVLDRRPSRGFLPL
jgi:hypothetical protein